jgi:MFS family permease
VTGILQIIFTFPSVLFLDKFGRKTFLMIGAAGMFLCHIIVAIVEGIYKPKWDLNEGLAQPQGWVAIAFIWLFAVNFAYSWGTLSLIIFSRSSLILTIYNRSCHLGLGSGDLP